MSALRIGRVSIEQTLALAGSGPCETSVSNFQGSWRRQMTAQLRVSNASPRQFQRHGAPDSKFEARVQRWAE